MRSPLESQEIDTLLQAAGIVLTRGLDPVWLICEYMLESSSAIF